MGDTDRLVPALSRRDCVAEALDVDVVAEKSRLDSSGCVVSLLARLGEERRGVSTSEQVDLYVRVIVNFRSTRTIRNAILFATCIPKLTIAESPGRGFYSVELFE